MAVLLYNLGKFLSQYEEKNSPFSRSLRSIMAKYTLVHSFVISISLEVVVTDITCAKISKDSRFRSKLVES